ncbi:hypothetical protein K523DRAFT_324239 [Schizophyllum commune Tattone D]|nr:hypothetical protein K523DRAFT_324239 [Schizophyllum commune Tattone D]
MDLSARLDHEIAALKDLDVDIRASTADLRDPEHAESFKEHSKKACDHRVEARNASNPFSRAYHVGAGLMEAKLARDDAEDVSPSLSKTSTETCWSSSSAPTRSNTGESTKTQDSREEAA